jgi:mono/diheme cytochrome c family protein
MKRLGAVVPLVAVAAVALSCRHLKPEESAPRNPAVKNIQGGRPDIEAYAGALIDQGRKVFRHDTFGSEAFWGGQLRLHEPIAGAERGGIGAGLTPHGALQLGLKVDSDAVPKVLLEVLKGGSISLDKEKTTLELLKADSVVGVKGFFDDPKDGGRLTGIGITCAICHSTVDDSFVKGIGQRLDGWPNRDLNIGAIVALAPNLKPMAEPLGISEDDLRNVLKSWGPGKYDAEVNHDGKAMRPDGKSGATLIPAAFGQAGVNLHTYTGWGSATHWNAYVANTQMHGKGTFFDPRMNDPVRFPVAAKQGHHNIRNNPDLITPKLAALHFYQLAIPAPKPKPDTFDAAAAERGRAVFEGKAQCARCHVPPLFTEPGWPMHTAAEMGIDDFQAGRSPDAKYYRTTPLRGLFVRAKGGFYHDGRFPDLPAVVAHYEGLLRLQLAPQEKTDLVQYLKSL